MIPARSVPLFGVDGDPGIVAVEFEEPNVAIVYRRGDLGDTKAGRIPFRPFLWRSGEVDGCVKLRGDAPLGFLQEFDSWKDFVRERATLREAGEVSFSLSDPVQQFLSRTGKTLFKEMEFADLRRMQVDIETTCSDGFEFSNSARDPLAAIALSDSSGWEELLVVEAGESESERRVLERFVELVLERDPDVLEGHNLFKFDLPYLAARSKQHKIRLRLGRDGSTMVSRSSRLQIAEKVIQYPKFEIHGRHVVDTFFLAQGYDVGTRELESFGLKAVARHFGINEPGRVVLNGSEIQSAYLANDPNFKTYALQDVRETRALAETLSQSHFVQASIFPFSYQDVMVRGNATKIDALFLREVLRHGQSLPDYPEVRAFEGGMTDIFVTGVIDDVWHCDVTSLYPSVMLAFQIFPAADQLGIFGGMLSELRAFRVDAKRRMREAADEAEQRRFDALQSTFKILINSFYGYLGFSQGHFADFDAAAAVTSKGREILQDMVRWLEKSGAKVIEIDTDGIYFKPAEGSEVGKLEVGIRDVLPDGIEVEFDRQYLAMFSYKAKNYALVGLDGTVMLKGAALKSRGLEPYLRDFLRGLVGAILDRDGNRARQLHSDLARAIRARELAIEALAKTETLQDSPAAYQKKIAAGGRNRSAAFELALAGDVTYVAGDSISYYITGDKKKVTAYNHAKRVADWQPDRRDENVEYYVGKLDELYKKFAGFIPAERDLFGI